MSVLNFLKFLHSKRNIPIDTSVLGDILKEKKVSLQEIAISKESYDSYKENPYDLVYEVVNYVNIIAQNYKQDEIPLESLEIFNVDYYLAQIINGGHSQFILNSKIDPLVLSYIENGLTKMRADEFLSIFQKMMNWISKNPEEIQAQTGFEGGIDPFLEDLDKEFYRLNQSKSGAYTLSFVMSEYIHGLDNLRVVEQKNLDEATQSILNSNPNKELRKIVILAKKIEYFLTDRKFYSFSLACGASSKIESIISLGGDMDLEGGKKAWSLLTLGGHKMGVIDGTGVSIYEQEQGKGYYDIKIGEKIVFLDSESIKHSQKLAMEYNSICVICALSSISTLKGNITSVSLISGKDDEVTLYLNTDSKDSRLVKISKTTAGIFDSQNKAFEVCLNQTDISNYAEDMKILLKKNNFSK